MSLFTIVLLGLVSVGAFIFFVALPRLSPNRKAFDLLRQAREDEALGEFLKAKERNPYDIIALYYLALLYSRKGNDDLARKNFNEIIRLDKFNSEVERIDVLTKLASLNLKINLFEEAFANYLNVLENDETNQIALFQLAYLCLGQGQFDKAADYFERYLRFQKKDFEALLGAAVANSALDKAEEAEELFSRALKENPQSKLTRLLAGLQFLNNKKFKDANDNLMQVLDQKSDPGLIYFVKRLLIFLMYKMNATRKAINEMGELIKLCKANSLTTVLFRLTFDMGIFHAAIQDWTLASSYLTIAEDLNHDNPEIGSMLKNLDYIQNGDEKAEKMLEDAIKRWEQKLIQQKKIYEMSGLKSKNIFSIQEAMGFKERKKNKGEKKGDSQDSNQSLKYDLPEQEISWDNLFNLNFLEFERMVYRIARKFGLEVVERLNTYREQDGIDLLCKEKNSGNSILIIFRRWKETFIGDIELRNISQTLREQRINKAHLMVTTGLTDGAVRTSETLQNIKIYSHEEIKSLIDSL